jgi:translation initiation factor IF-2
MPLQSGLPFQPGMMPGYEGQTPPPGYEDFAPGQMPPASMGTPVPFQMMAPPDGQGSQFGPPPGYEGQYQGQQPPSDYQQGPAPGYEGQYQGPPPGSQPPPPEPSSLRKSWQLVSNILFSLFEFLR